MEESKILSILFSRCINIHHNDILRSDLAVFSLCGSNTYSIRWSYDKELCFSKKVKNALDVFNREYISNVRYSVKKKMLPHQILVIDNKRTLHGREEVFGERFYRRVWIYDEEASEPLSNPDSPILYKTHRPHNDALIALQNFNPIENEGALKLNNPIPSGIILNNETECKLRELLLKYLSDKLNKQQHHY